MITGLMASTECTSRFCKHQYEFKFSIVMYCIVLDNTHNIYSTLTPGPTHLLFEYDNLNGQL